jgi:hypothetical protein
MFFLVALFASLTGGTYGSVLLDFGASIYPGYHGPGGGFGSVIVVTLYALVDGAIAGALLAWLYNRFNSSGTGGEPA